jgi:hypothetical protein
VVAVAVVVDASVLLGDALEVAVTPAYRRDATDREGTAAHRLQVQVAGLAGWLGRGEVGLSGGGVRVGPSGPGALLLSAPAGVVLDLSRERGDLAVEGRGLAERAIGTVLVGGDGRE